MKEIIENLFPMNRTLVGEGMDNALLYIKELIDLDIKEVPSGTKLGTWTVPDEWIVRGAKLSSNGKTILDYNKNPMSLVVGSLPFTGVVTHEELLKHINTSSDNPDSTPYIYKYYDKDWGFSMPFNKAKELTEGRYMVQIDTEYRPGIMKYGVHTIKGKSDREILLFAHLDHPFQANDNLSGVATLVDLATKLKCDHTVKIVFCGETIGSIAYANLEDISKVDFVIALDVCGNDGMFTVQKSFNQEDRLNRVFHTALHALDIQHRKGVFRSVVGSDEYIFNDPLIGIPGLMISTWPYQTYHTDADTPENIDYAKMEEAGKIIAKIIEVYEADFIPSRNFTGPLMRSKYGIQSDSKQMNFAWDYFFYIMDGVKTLAELCTTCDIDFDTALTAINKMIDDKAITRSDIGQKPVKKTAGKKQSRLPRSANVRGKSKKVS
jgi:aminopeptidase-like protein